jgi:hypothetical protein
LESTVEKRAHGCGKKKGFSLSSELSEEEEDEESSASSC